MIGALAAAAAILLAASGLAKVRTPGAAAAMLATLVPRARRSKPRLSAVVRAGGVFEVTVAVLVLALGGPIPAALLAGCYLVFAVVAVGLASGGRPTPCGCFGRADSAVGPAHVVLDVVCFAIAGAAVMQPVGVGGGLFGHGGTIAAIGCMQVLLLAWLGYLMITALPALSAARHLGEAR